MPGGLVYSVALTDGYSRYGMAWQGANTRDATFCLEALEAALARQGTAAIFDTDQGCPAGLTDRLQTTKVAVSADGHARVFDPAVVHCLRSLLGRTRIRAMMEPPYSRACYHFPRSPRCGPDADPARGAEGVARHDMADALCAAVRVAGRNPSGAACVPRCGVARDSRRTRYARSPRLAVQHTGPAAAIAGSANRP